MNRNELWDELEKNLYDYLGHSIEQFTETSAVLWVLDNQEKIKQLLSQ